MACSMDRTAAELPNPDLAGAMRQHLKELLSSGLFVRSRDLCRFLTFTVEAVIQGRANDLKEYSVGVEVFHRGPDFDPAADPIVRVQAGRLRRKLETCYRQHPSGVRIQVPTGAYVPRFIAPTAAEAGNMFIAILPFQCPANPALKCFRDGLMEELIHVLAQHKDLRVLSRTSCMRYESEPCDVRHIAEELHVQGLLEGSVREESGRFRILTQLVDARRGWCVWSGASTVLPGRNAARVQREYASSLSELLDQKPQVSGARLSVTWRLR